MSLYLSRRRIDSLIEEDCPYMDLTVDALEIEHEPGLLECFPKAPCTVAGVEEAAQLLEATGCRVTRTVSSGAHVDREHVFLRAKGHAGAIHRSLKVAQNIMEYASGIATRTADMLSRARRENPDIEVAVTRKHFPGTKHLSLAAAIAGGATVHRLGLSDSILIFDQHRAFTTNGTDDADGMTGLAARLAHIRRHYPERKVGVEVASFAEALRMASAGADSIQCERFTCAELAETVRAVKQLDSRICVLAAGGVTAENAAEYAKTGVDVLVTTWVYFGKPMDIKMRVRAAQPSS